MAYFPSFQIKQNVTIDAGNSSVVNLEADATFTGEGTSTLGISGVHVSLKTDQNCLIYVDQSSDGENWDVTDHGASPVAS
jgi:hypothetical protein